MSVLSILAKHLQPTLNSKVIIDLLVLVPKLARFKTAHRYCLCFQLNVLKASLDKPWSLTIQKTRNLFVYLGYEAKWKKSTFFLLKQIHRRKLGSNTNIFLQQWPQRYDHQHRGIFPYISTLIIHLPPSRCYSKSIEI